MENLVRAAFFLAGAVFGGSLVLYVFTKALTSGQLTPETSFPPCWVCNGESTQCFVGGRGKRTVLTLGACPEHADQVRHLRDLRMFRAPNDAA